VLTLQPSGLGHDPRQQDPAAPRPGSAVGHLRVVLAELDAQGRFLLAEGQGLASLGLTPGEIVGRTVDEVCACHPEIIGAFHDALAGRPSTGPARFAGGTFELNVTPVVGPDGRVERVLAVAHDVTELLRAAAERAETEARLRDFAQASGDWLWATNAEHRFTTRAVQFCDVGRP
jgi:PAS domain-containing protein